MTKLPVESRRFNGACIDPPSDADIYEAKLRDGDIIVLFVRLYWLGLLVILIAILLLL